MTELPSHNSFTDIPESDALAQPKHRHDGWSPDRQVVFLEALARTGNVRAAARYAGLSRESAYKLRRRADARAFARAWDAAILHAREIFQDELMDRGLNGWNEAVWHQGEQVGTRERWSAPLFLAALGRLDKMADGIDLAGKPARVAAERFDDLLDGIGAGEDCAALVDEIDEAGEVGHAGSAALPHAQIMNALQLSVGRERIETMATEAMNMPDLDMEYCDQRDGLNQEQQESEAADIEGASDVRIV
ncbi:MAG: hypothetical protein ABJO01_10785 [Parasphingorhabdus sp.]|uniref:hypothetical protein n=1 Tax=Parasphingorhabdus sp. TaxID=2709688 RepID=UPI0032967CA5